MFVYRRQIRRVEPARALRQLRGHGAREVLMGVGEIEAAVVDALCRECDCVSPLASALREASLLAARGLPEQALDRMEALALPARAELSVPEGYAYYSLYPEMYRAAARRFVEEVRPESAVVVGIRSIGTSLSAAVAAALERLGCRVWSWTVRPHGHPFQRRLQLSAELERELAAHTGAPFLVVDEGPGLSGSSLTSVAERLSELGIADERIVLFPSWAPDGGAFVSAQARRRWQRHRKYVASFEEVWPQYAAYEDLSAGRWRRLFWSDERAWPAAQPQHERRKYRDQSVLLKFAGLGHYGTARYERAGRSAAAGVGPQTLGLDNGFLQMRFVAGRPLSRSDACPEFIEFAARYFAYLQRDCPGERSVAFDELLEIIRINAGERYAEKMAGCRAMVEDAPATAIDGRLLPHEWLHTAGGYLKTDGIDHHDDHFLPGCQDIAWDLAGACTEFDLDQGALVARYESLSGDRDVARRLPFYRVAYAALRLGYATLAQTAIAGSPDAARFARAARQYRRSLSAALTSAGRK